MVPNVVIDDEPTTGEKSEVALLAAVPKVRYANTSVPIAKPKLLLAVIASVAPVPPLAIETVPDK